MRRRTLASLVAGLLLVASVGAVATVSYVAADRLVHPPRDLDPATPLTRGLAFDTYTMRTDDGLALSAWWIPSGAVAPTVVFLHGYGASKAQSLAVAPFLHAAGYNVLAFDFRAHGASSGGHTTIGLDEVHDVRAAVADARARSAGPVALMGWSMGAATALNAAAHDLKVDAIVADSPFATLDEVATRIFAKEARLPAFPFEPLSIAWASWMVKRSVNEDRPVDGVRSIASPLLIIQGLRDPYVSDAGARKMHEDAGGSELWLVPDAHHLGAVESDPTGYKSHVLDFLALSLTGGARASSARPALG